MSDAQPRVVFGWTVEQPDADTFVAKHPDGRSMKVQVPAFVDTFDLTETIAAVDDPFGKFQRLAMVAFAVTEINGVPVPRPRTKAALRESGKALSNEQFAVAALILFPTASQDAGETPDTALAAAKN